MSMLLLLHRRTRTLTSLLCNSTLTPTLTLTQTHSLSPSPSFPLQTFSFRSSFSSKTKNSKQQQQEEAEKEGNEAKKNKNKKKKKINNSSSESSVGDSEYPSDEFQLQEFSWWRKLPVKLKMLTALPRERIPNATVLTMKIRREIFEQLESRYSSELSLPQICENIIKAAYDLCISGIYLHIETLSCGWAKIDEIRRHILDFKKSGKFIVAYVPECCEEEYYLACACEEIYAPPSAYFSLFGLTVEASFLREIELEVERIGKYKSAGDQLTCKTMSEENCEMLIALPDNVYEKWLDKVSSAKGKSREDLENFINQGVYQVEKLKEEGWIINKCYDDEVQNSTPRSRGLKYTRKNQCLLLHLLRILKDI